MDSADRNPISSIAGVSSHRLFHVSSLEPMCDEFSAVVGFNKLFRDSQFSAVASLCNLCFCLTLRGRWGKTANRLRRPPLCISVAFCRADAPLPTLT